MPMRISGGLRVEKLARQARSEWPESEDVEDVDAVDATLGDRECSDRLLLRLGGLIWGALDELLYRPIYAGCFLVSGPTLR